MAGSTWGGRAGGRTRRPAVAWTLAVVALLPLAGCGTRVAPQATGNQPAASLPGLHPAGGASIEAAPPGPPAATGAGPAAGPTTPSLRGVAPTAPNGGMSGAAPSRAVPAVTAPAGPPAAAAGRTTTAADPAAPQASGQPPPKAANAPAVRAPVTIASVGTNSGPAANALLGAVQGAQVWVKDVNARGGLNGHPVNLVVYDDGGDPARHRAQVQEAVETRGAIAFLQNNEALTGQASVDYITSKRVPVVGGDSGSPWFYESPMFFPQATVIPGLNQVLIASAAQRAVPAGRTKLGTIVCVEADGCRRAEKDFAAVAGKVGFDYVYKASASLTQPDYTAECLSARNAGVQALAVILDANSIDRLSAACTRQGFTVPIAAHHVILHDSQKDNPNLEGILAATVVIPWFATGSPAADEYQQAIRRYGKGVTLGGAVPAGWTSGKLLERAVAHQPEPLDGDAILNGLWTVKDDNLGGLTEPLTFVRDKPNPQRTCWINITIHNRQWVNSDGYRWNCLD